MKLATSSLIALALFVTAPAYALQLQPVSGDARQADRDAIHDPHPEDLPGLQRQGCRHNPRHPRSFMDWFPVLFQDDR